MSSSLSVREKILNRGYVLYDNSIYAKEKTCKLEYDDENKTTYTVSFMYVIKLNEYEEVESLNCVPNQSNTCDYISNDIEAKVWQEMLEEYMTDLEEIVKKQELLYYDN